MGFWDSLKAGLFGAAGVDYYAMQTRDEVRKLNARYDLPTPTISPTEFESVCEDAIAIAQDVMITGFKAVWAATQSMSDWETWIGIWKSWANDALPKLDPSKAKFDYLLVAIGREPSDPVWQLFKELDDTVGVLWPTAAKRVASATSPAEVLDGCNEIMAASKHWNAILDQVEAFTGHKAV